VLQPGTGKRRVCPGKILLQGAAAPGLVRWMAMTESEIADGRHRVEKQDSAYIDALSRGRFIHRKGTFEHRILVLLKDHVGEILVSIAVHRSGVIDDTSYLLAVRINDDVVKAQVAVHQHWMIILDCSAPFERHGDAPDQPGIPGHRRCMAEVLGTGPVRDACKPAFELCRGYMRMLLRQDSTEILAEPAGECRIAPDALVQTGRSNRPVHSSAQVPAGRVLMDHARRWKMAVGLEQPQHTTFLGEDAPALRIRGEPGNPIRREPDCDPALPCAALRCCAILGESCLQERCPRILRCPVMSAQGRRPGNLSRTAGAISSTVCIRPMICTAVHAGLHAHLGRTARVKRLLPSRAHQRSQRCSAVAIAAAG
jgi:hypothetical protein